uniref:RING-type domain-containing protein n=1 Tax=Glycine max TaxID=3847 RepID=A0A0R0J2M4_SOYBN
MSSQIRRERREWSRVPPQGATRQEWVPRGAAAAAASTNVAQPSNLHSNNNADAGSSNLGVAVAAPSVSRSRSNNHGNDVGSSNQGVAVAALPVSRGRSNNHGNDAGFSNQGVAVAALPVSHGRSNNHGNDAGPSNQGVAVASPPVSHGRSNNPGNGAGSSNQGLAVAAPPVNRGRSKNHGKDSVSSNQGVAVAALGSRGRSNNHGSHWMEMEKDKGSRSGSQVEKGLRVGVRDSSLPQLVQEIQEKLMKGTVECMICYEMVQRSVPVWSCSSCYSIFHLNCIKKWARAPISSDLSLSVEKNHELNWRCPGCQSVKFTSSKEIRYVCFCGKRIDPPSDLYLTPHSCGEPCGKPLQREVLVPGGNRDDLCPHACVLQCHPGPCPPCKAFAPPRLCPCGKKNITTRCSDRQSVLTCGQCCGKLLECGRHRCERICHVGSCDPCKVPSSATCFCSKNMEVVLCGDMTVKGEIEAKGSCVECELLPSRVKTCCCGKTRLENERQSCLDPIPTCSKVCGKLLHCGMHSCKEACHVGECPPCLVEVSQKCCCGSTSRTVECYKTMMENEKFMCEKSCGIKKNCGRHRCSERCCPFSNSNHYNTFSGDWVPHFCSMPCGKKLRCGQHVCECLCHSGHCPPCFQTIFNELACACGRTSIPPPLPCGTPPPSCQLPCSVPQPCGHSVSHSCHFGDCPPCSVPVAKECIGGHVVLRNIPCGSKDIRCNHPCGKTRQCGLHACGRTCHPPPCDNLSGVVQGFKAPCGQTCGAPRRSCRHTCMAPCHPSSPCPDIRCEFPVTITCSCGRITANVPCDVGGSSSNYNADAIHEASIIQTLPVPLQPVDANGKKVPLGQRKLICDDECSKLERKRVLADAFDITAPNLDSLHFGDNSLSSELLLDFFRREPKWVLAVEERCKILVLGKTRGTGTTHGLKVHIFCPMLKEKRDAVRLIADRWKLAITAAGWEPKRFIVISVTPKSKAPARVIGVKGTTTLNVPLPPVFDPLVDMDLRLVVSFPDLPRDTEINSLVLRFGGECELVWLNDKNALAVFHDPARAATAMRRLDYATVYQGAVLVAPNAGALVASSATNAWGGAGAMKGGGALPALKGNSWKKAVAQDSGWEDSWGGEEWIAGSVNIQPSVWKKEAPLAASLNRWNVLEQESSSSLSSTTVRAEVSGKKTENAGEEGGSKEEEKLDAASEVVDDWEKAYE